VTARTCLARPTMMRAARPVLQGDSERTCRLCYCHFNEPNYERHMYIARQLRNDHRAARSQRGARSILGFLLGVMLGVVAAEADADVT
jgi:hypothetical protein